MLAKSLTLHIPGTGPDGDKERGHLFVIVTDRCREKKHLLVPVCSAHPKCDKSCLLGIGDHPFIKHASFVSYGQAHLYEAETLEIKIKEKVVSVRESINAKIFARICMGLVDSRYTAPKIMDYYLRNKANQYQRP